MMSSPSSSTNLQLLLDCLQNGDDSARSAVITHSLERFRVLARRLLRRNADLRRIDETDDVLQKAMVRLHRALGHVRPPNVRALIGLAAQQIRWVLGDLVREASSTTRPHLSLSGMSGPLQADELPSPQSGEPGTLLEWADFHAAIERLPAEHRDLFDLLFYQGLTQPLAAELLGLSLRTVKRRWQHARLALQDALQGECPPLEGDRR
ncbi:MAG: RNA polymerase sigma factor [Gemmataceae bacterium]